MDQAANSPEGVAADATTPDAADGAAAPGPGDVAKARAVAALQRLFFEELSRGQDPSGAAARALTRLKEAQAQLVEDTPVPAAAAPEPAATEKAEIEVARAFSPLPLHPSPVISRQPSPFVRIAVQS